MRQRPLVALDLGSTKVACVIAQPDGQGYEVLGAGLARYPLTVPAWPCDTPMMAQTIDAALEQAGVVDRIERALVCVSHRELSHHQTIAQIDLAHEPVAIRPPALQRLKAQAVAQTLSIDREVLRIESLGYDGNGFAAVRDPRGLSATRLRGTFQVVAIPINVQKAIAQAMETVGLEVERLMYSLPAVAAACVEPSRRDGRVLVVDIGGRTTDVALLDRMALLRSATIPWGGLVLSEALAASGRLTLDASLAASLEGLASPKPEVRALLTEQLAQVRHALEELLKDQAMPDAAVVTGGGALIDGLVEWVEKELGVPATLGRSLRATRFSEFSTQVTFTAAMGLIELACEATPKQIPRSPHFLNRLIQTTKTVLNDYF